MVFQPGPCFGVDQSEQHQPRIAGNFRHDPVKVLLRADHRPEVADNVRPFELGKRRLGDHLKRFAGRIRQEVKMQTRHGERVNGPCG